MYACENVKTTGKYKYVFSNHTHRSKDANDYQSIYPQATIGINILIRFKVILYIIPPVFARSTVVGLSV